jgi:hypothetical protein
LTAATAEEDSMINSKKVSFYPRLVELGMSEDNPSDLLEKVLCHAERETERFVSPIRQNISEIASKAVSVGESFRNSGG